METGAFVKNKVLRSLLYINNNKQIKCYHKKQIFRKNMHYSISLFFCIYRGGRGSMCEKVVVTKGIFPPQPLHQEVVGKRIKTPSSSGHTR